MANLAVAQRRAGTDEAAQLQRTRDAAVRLRRVVSALLTMFRSGGEAQRQAVNLDDLASLLPFDCLDFQIAPDATVDAGPGLVARAPEGRLRLLLGQSGRGVELGLGAVR